jgi:phage-related protein
MSSGWATRSEGLQASLDQLKWYSHMGILLAERGQRHPRAKPLTGIPVTEISDEYDGNAFRAVYVTELDDWVYVLHCFKKKSKKGAKTPQPDIDLINKRLKEARLIHAKRQKDQARKK